MAEKVPSTVNDAILLEKQLFEACRVGDVDAVRRLVPDKVDVNANAYHGWSYLMTPLHEACLHKRLNVVEALLELKAEINRKDNTGRTPLHIACFNNHLDLVRVLIAGGADANIVNKQGNTPLHIALGMGGYYLLKALLSADGSPDSAPLVDVNRRDQSGNTPLYYACQKGSINSVKLLFSKGAEIHDKEEQKKLILDVRARNLPNMDTYLAQRFTGHT